MGRRAFAGLVLLIVPAGSSGAERVHVSFLNGGTSAEWVAGLASDGPGAVWGFPTNDCLSCELCPLTAGCQVSALTTPGACSGHLRECDDNASRFSAAGMPHDSRGVFRAPPRVRRQRFPILGGGNSRDRDGGSPPQAQQ